MRLRMLQWGRNFIVAETCKTTRRIVAESVHASMGPQLYRCGNMKTLTIVGLDTWLCSLQWGRNFIVAETGCPVRSMSCWLSLYRCGLSILPRRFASMGPQLYRCGNQATEAEDRIGDHWLQWGRNFIVAETQALGRPLEVAHTQASMGPQLYRCGNEEVRRTVQVAKTASMGPQLYRCGKQYLRPKALLVASFNGAATLSLRKRGASRPDDSGMVLLQWGRNFIVAETCPGASSETPPEWT